MLATGDAEHTAYRAQCIGYVAMRL
jgi:hypothetical protein